MHTVADLNYKHFAPNGASGYNCCFELQHVALPELQDTIAVLRYKHFAPPELMHTLPI